ncbi:hypothetical protein STEG23_008600 [Scotinomys teguina]
MVLWGSLAAVAMFFLIIILIFLCSSCDREKKPKKHSGDHENLMNVPSDKEMFSHSATSLTTDALASSEQNGVLTNGDSIRHASHVQICMQAELPTWKIEILLLSKENRTAPKAKSHQSESCPGSPENAVGSCSQPGLWMGTRPGVEGPKVLKDSSSQENMVEDCLYETVKEIKEVADKGQSGKSKSTSALKELQGPHTEGKADFAEYASVDRNKKCRQSINAEHSGNQ